MGTTKKVQRRRSVSKFNSFAERRRQSRSRIKIMRGAPKHWKLDIGLTLIFLEFASFQDNDIELYTVHSFSNKSSNHYNFTTTSRADEDFYFIKS
jgi:hypothetical protein